MDLFECLIEEYYLQGATMIKRFREKFFIDLISKKVKEIDVHDFNTIYFILSPNKTDLDFEYFLKWENYDDEKDNVIKYNEIVMRIFLTIIYNIKMDIPNSIDSNQINNIISFFRKEIQDGSKKKKLSNQNIKTNENINYDDHYNYNNDLDDIDNLNEKISDKEKIFTEGGIRKTLDLLLKIIDTGLDKSEEDFKKDLSNICYFILNNTFEEDEKNKNFEPSEYKYSNFFSSKMNMYKLTKLSENFANPGDKYDFYKSYEDYKNGLLKKYFFKTPNVDNSKNINNTSNHINANHNLNESMNFNKKTQIFNNSFNINNINNNNFHNQTIHRNYNPQNNNYKNTLNQNLNNISTYGTQMFPMSNQNEEKIKEEEENENNKKDFLNKFRVKYLMFEKSLVDEHESNKYFFNFINSIYTVQNNIDKEKEKNNNSNNVYNELSNVNMNTNNNNKIKEEYLSNKENQNINNLTRNGMSDINSSYKDKEKDFEPSSEFNILVYLLPNYNDKNKYNNICTHISNKDYIYKMFLNNIWSNYDKYNDVKQVYESHNANDIERIEFSKDELIKNIKSIFKFTLQKYLNDANYIFDLYTYEIKIYNKSNDVIFSKIFCQNFEMFLKMKFEDQDKAIFEKKKNYMKFDIT